MAFIINTTNKEKSVCCQGNWFVFKPKQIKNIASESVVIFMTTTLSHEGLVRLSDRFEDPDFKKTAAGMEEYAEAVEKGTSSRVAWLQYIINNDLVSLRQDLARNNDTTEPELLISKGCMELMKELAEYKEKLSAAKKEQVAQINELKKQIN